MSLEERIEAAVRAVPDVLALYSTGVTGRLVSATDTAVFVSVGVDGTRPASVTAAAVAVAIRAELATPGTTRLTVRVARVA